MIFLFAAPHMQEWRPQPQSHLLWETLGAPVSLSPDVGLTAFAHFPLNPALLLSQQPQVPSPQSWPFSLRACLQTFIHYAFTSSHCGHLPSQIPWVGWKLRWKRNICLCSFQLAPRHTSQVHSFTVALIIAFRHSPGEELWKMPVSLGAAFAGSGHFTLAIFYHVTSVLSLSPTNWGPPFVPLLNCMWRQNLDCFSAFIFKPRSFILV